MSPRLVRVILISQAKLEFEGLERMAGEQQMHDLSNSPEQQLLKSIKQKRDMLKLNPTYGDSVPKEQIPASMDVSNLFVVDLNRYWRMLYTLEGNQVEIVAFVLNIVDHPTYDEIFGYRKK